MIRLHVICEGSTEEMFVNELLFSYFLEKHIHIIPSKIGKPGHKGGNVNFERLFTDVKLRLRRDERCYCTTMLDYYGLPADFPGKTASGTILSSRSKLECVVEALSKMMSDRLDGASTRFIPYIQLHEFEALLFSRPDVLASSLQQPKLEDAFVRIRKGYPTPEDINDSVETAPGKRIERLFPEYDKPVHPVLVAKAIGLEAMREQCLLFDEWIKRLEFLSAK